MGARRATKSKSFYHISIKFRQSIKNSIFDRKAHVYYLLFNEIISSYQDKCVLHLKIRFQDSSPPHVPHSQGNHQNRNPHNQQPWAALHIASGEKLLFRLDSPGMQDSRHIPTMNLSSRNSDNPSKSRCN